MRTFSLFPTDDREHRLIHMDGSDAPTTVPEAPDTPAPTPESVEPTTTFESPEDLNLAADASVEAADADISGMEAPIDEVDQIMNESEGDISADPAVAQTQVDLNAAINGTADFVQGAGDTLHQGANFIRGFAGKPGEPLSNEDSVFFGTEVNEEGKDVRVYLGYPDERTEKDKGGVANGAADFVQGAGDSLHQGADFIRGFAGKPADAEVPQSEEEPDYAKMDMADMPGYDSEGNPLPEETVSEEDAPIDPEFAEEEEPTTEEEDETTTEEEEPVAEEEEPVAEDEEPTVEEEEESATEEEEPTATEEDETTQEATEEDETTTESKETPAESYEKEKIDQRMSREYEKMSDVASGNPDQWSMIDNGKTDGTGKPFLYKEGTNEKGEKVLLAYAPSTGVQVMNVTTGEWRFMNQMSPEEQAKIKGAEGMGEAEHAAALDAAKQQDPDAFTKRMEQNERNFSMEEDCLKNIAADPQWFADHFDDPMWKGNEDVRDALAAALKEPGTAAEKPVTEEPATPAEDSEDTEDTEENPEIAELKKLIEEMKKKLQEMSDRLDTLEGKTGETKDEDAEEEDETKDEGSETKDETDEDAETDEDLSAAEIAEKNKKETDEALAELDGEKADEGETEDDAETTESGESEVEAVKEVEESDETDDEVRARLISEVRNADPMKTVDELTTEKNDAFEKVKEKSDEAIDNAENAERDQDKKVDGLKDQIKDLKQERAGAKKGERGAIDAKISQAESDLATAEATLKTLEGNTETLRKNLETAKDQHDRDITTLETLEAEWTTTAEKADKKFDEMGTKLISLGDGEVGTIVQGINVEHDGSLGLKITGNVAPLATFLESILDENDMKKLTVGDNPSIALKGVAALIQGVEQKKEAEATAPTEQTEETPVETPTEAPAEKTEEATEEPTTESDDSAEDAPTEEK